MRKNNNYRDAKRIHLRGNEQETDCFRQTEQKHQRPASLIVILAVLLFCLFWISLLFLVPYSRFHMTPAWFFEHVRDRFTHLYLFLFGMDSGSFAATFYQHLAVIFVGGALAACGAVLQGSFRNVLAGPSTMGVMSGGTAGCLFYLLVFTESTTVAVNTTADMSAYYSAGFFKVYCQQFCVLIGCVAGVLLILGIATIAGRGRLSPMAMILSGTVFSNAIGNLTMLVQYYMILKDPEDTRIDALQDLMMGNFDGVSDLRTLLMLILPILICLIVICCLANRLNLLSLGETEALTMGINVKFYRYLMVALSSLLTALVVAFCGRIGFLGFMIPLVGRKLAGANMRRLVPASILLGAILLTLVYDVAYVAGMTDYLNLFTSSIGCIVMAVTLFLGKGGRRDAAFQTGITPRMGMR